MWVCEVPQSLQHGFPQSPFGEPEHPQEAAASFLCMQARCHTRHRCVLLLGPGPWPFSQALAFETQASRRTQSCPTPCQLPCRGPFHPWVWFTLKLEKRWRGDQVKGWMGTGGHNFLLVVVFIGQGASKERKGPGPTSKCSYSR